VLVGLPASLLRSFNDLILCAICRHLSLPLWYVLGGAPKCSHAGIWSFSSWDNFISAKLMLCFHAIFNILMIRFGRRFASFPKVGGSHEVRKVLMSSWCLIPFGFSVFIITSVIHAQVGWDSDKFM
jgi:hypothetical protein